MRQQSVTFLEIIQFCKYIKWHKGQPGTFKQCDLVFNEKKRTGQYFSGKLQIFWFSLLTCVGVFGHLIIWARAAFVQFFLRGLWSGSRRAGALDGADTRSGDFHKRLDGERRQPSRVSSTLAAAEVLNGKLPQRLPTSPSSRSHHSTENPSYFRPLPYRVAMAPTGLRFLAGNQNQVQIFCFDLKRHCCCDPGWPGDLQEVLRREQQRRLLHGEPAWPRGDGENGGRPSNLGKGEPGTQQPILGNLEHFLGIPKLVVILELWPEIKRRGCWPWLRISLLIYHCWATLWHLFHSKLYSN